MDCPAGCLSCSLSAASCTHIMWCVLLCGVTRSRRKEPILEPVERCSYCNCFVAAAAAAKAAAATVCIERWGTNVEAPSVLSYVPS